MKGLTLQELVDIGCDQVWDDYADKALRSLVIAVHDDDITKILPVPELDAFHDTLFEACRIAKGTGALQYVIIAVLRDPSTRKTAVFILADDGEDRDKAALVIVGTSGDPYKDLALGTHWNGEELVEPTIWMGERAELNWGIKDDWWGTA
jgi:hypothetical protein